MIHSSYLNSLFNEDTFRKTVSKAIHYLRTRSSEFDAVAFMGYSGSLVAPIVALTLRKKMIIVRKETSHGDHVEGADCERYIIIDDFISSGKTVNSIISKINKSRLKGKVVGIYLWKSVYKDSHVSEHGTIPIWKTPKDPKKK